MHRQSIIASRQSGQISSLASSHAPRQSRHRHSSPLRQSATGISVSHPPHRGGNMRLSKTDDIIFPPSAFFFIVAHRRPLVNGQNQGAVALSVQQPLYSPIALKALRVSRRDFSKALRKPLFMLRYNTVPGQTTARDIYRPHPPQGPRGCRAERRLPRERPRSHRRTCRRRVGG